MKNSRKTMRVFCCPAFVNVVSFIILSHVEVVASNNGTNGSGKYIFSSISPGIFIAFHPLTIAKFRVIFAGTLSVEIRRIKRRFKWVYIFIIREQEC